MNQYSGLSIHMLTRISERNKHFSIVFPPWLQGMRPIMVFLHLYRPSSSNTVGQDATHSAEPQEAQGFPRGRWWETGVQSVFLGVWDCGNWLGWLIQRMCVGEAVLGTEYHGSAELSSWPRGLEMNTVLSACAQPSSATATLSLILCRKQNTWPTFLPLTIFKCEAWHWWSCEHWMADLEKLLSYDTEMLYPLKNQLAAIFHRQSTLFPLGCSRCRMRDSSSWGCLSHLALYLPCCKVCCLLICRFYSHHTHILSTTFSTSS